MCIEFSANLVPAGTSDRVHAHGCCRHAEVQSSRDEWHGSLPQVRWTCSSLTYDTMPKNLPLYVEALAKVKDASPFEKVKLWVR